MRFNVVDLQHAICSVRIVTAFCKGWKVIRNSLLVFLGSWIAGGVVIAQAAPSALNYGYCVDASVGSTYRSTTKLSAKPYASLTFSCPNDSGAPRGSTAQSSVDVAATTATASVRLATTDGDSSILNGAISEADYGDVLYFSIAGAERSTLTSIPVSSIFTGSGSDPAPIYASQSRAYISLADYTSCTSSCWPGQAAFDGLKLPQAKGVDRSVEFLPPAVFGTQSYADTLVLQGPSAVVPVIVSAAALGYGYRPWETSRPFVNYSFSASFTLTLPPGVTCRSRSGIALGGICPK